MYKHFGMHFRTSRENEIRASVHFIPNPKDGEFVIPAPLLY